MASCSAASRLLLPATATTQQGSSSLEKKITGAGMAIRWPPLGDYSKYLPNTLLEPNRLYQNNHLRTSEMEILFPATKASHGGRGHGGQGDGNTEESSAKTSDDLEEQDSQDNEQQYLKPTKRE
ncbi:MAG: hypothetical protein Q9188_001192 [Gyalolechia gomerana]